MKHLPNALLLLLVIPFACTQRPGRDVQVPGFELLLPTVTGIHFENQIRDSAHINILNFRNFYNGAGVAIGDINNDGKPDIFFSSNQQTNKLYLNKGNWQFEDISQSAGIEGMNRWHTGVNMIDINADGWLDIYVCNSGDVAGNFRKNELYINLQNNSFRESAAEYGLDDEGIGTQAAFFDYDRDGDLDCFILNNSFRPIESFGYDKRIRHIRSTQGGHRLLKNDNGKFIDVSEEAGIFGSEIAFGLGVSIGDLNNDGWPDLYVSNDFFERDYLYINQKNGHFTESVMDRTGHTSLASMGSDIMDINDDGHLDIFTTDMLPEPDYRLKTTTRFDDYDVYVSKLHNDFHHQFQANCLQLNDGNGHFKEIAAYAGVQATDWSWGALSFDFNNDGWKDIFVSNGIYKDLTEQDFLDFYSNADVRQKAMATGFSYQEFLQKLKSTPISNYAFVNQKNLQFKNEAEALGLANPSFSNGGAYGDLDGDGDLDLIVNNVNMPAFVYRNQTSEKNKTNYLKIECKGEKQNPFGIGTRVSLYANGLQQVAENYTSRGFQSSVEPVLLFGLDTCRRIDSIKIQWPTGKTETRYGIAANQTLTITASDSLQENEQPQPTANPYFAEAASTNILHRENHYVDFNRERLIPKMLSAEGPCLAVGDLNNDGRDDLLVGNASGDTASIYFQQANGQFTRYQPNAFAQDRLCETVDAAFFDADGDGDLDIVMASGGNQWPIGHINQQVRLYLNDGRGNFEKAFTGWPVVSTNASCLVVADFNQDQLPDVFIGARAVPGQYGVLPSSTLLVNKGNGLFADQTASLAPDLEQLGMVTAAAITNSSEATSPTLVIVGDWMPICFFQFREGHLKKTKELEHSSGWWETVAIADLDGNGLPDIIAGNLGSNSKIKADQQHPAELYVADFDQNGQTEAIPAYYKSDGKQYPYPLKGDLVAQLPFLKKKFLHYADYAGKSIQEVLGVDLIKKASILKVQETRSMIWYQVASGKFESMPLPLEAQFSTINAAFIKDIDQDGKPDLILGGNNVGLKPETGRYDASSGLVFLNNGNRRWRYIPNFVSGWQSPGEIRALTSISRNNTTQLVVGRNNDTVQFFRFTR